MGNFALTNVTRLRKSIYSLLFALLISIQGISQNVAINVSGNPPDPSAGLDVDFPNMGLLIPRVALTGTVNFAPLSAHVAGMIVYNTATAGDVVPGFYYNDGTKWLSGFPNGNAIGNMLYWNGTNWVLIPAGLPGQYLQISGSNLPVWGSIIPATPTIVTAAASAITGITATSGANISSDGGSPVLSRGICYSTATGPTIANTKIIDASGGIGTYVSSLTGLLPVTTYYVRAYAMNSTSINYGNEITFTTLSVLPTLAATTAATLITGTTATSGGNVTATGGSPITERGICFGTAALPTIANTKVIDPAPGVGSFVSNLTGLIPGTTYYVRSYATSTAGTAYGTQISFAALMIPPTVTTTAATAITAITATSGGFYTMNGIGGNLWSYGVAYSTTAGSTNPTYVQTGTTPVTPFVTNLTGLNGSTTYYIRAYIYGFWNGAAKYDFGNELSFTTLAPTAPVVASTTAVTNITSVSGTSGGAITSDGGAPVTAKGVCWGTSANPTVGTGNFTSDGTGTLTFGSNVSGLTASTTYYIRAYATNSIGTSYAPQVTFTTCGTPYYTIGQNVQGGIVFYVDCTGLAGLIAAPADQGSGIPWGCEGTVTGATGTAIYSGAANTASILAACATPGIAARLCASYNGGGYTDWYLPSSGELAEMAKQYALLNLTSGLMTYWSSTESGATVAGGYFVYGGYSMSAMKGYGGQMVVRAIRKWTSTGPVLPVLTTDPITNLTNTSATSGGNITSDGGSPITARGVCWALTSGPTITTSLGFTSNGTGIGAFVSSITGLTTGNTYFLRAYATNSLGTFYGNEEIFIAVAGTTPSVTTNPMGSLIGGVAEGSGTVDNEGSTPVISYGLCWSDVPAPTVNTNLGMTTTLTAFLPVTGLLPYLYNNTITGLTVGTTYYVRAYASNSYGAGYGTEVSFVATAATLGQNVTINWVTGVVFSTDGTHGLIADLASPWGVSDWGCSSVTTGATGTTVGTGLSNTLAIIPSNATCISTGPFGIFAADMTQIYGPDWYLPSKDEFDLLWTNQAVDPNLAANLAGALLAGPFWSSSEVDASNAWSFDGTAWLNVSPKTGLNNVWPIRSF